MFDPLHEALQAFLGVSALISMRVAAHDKLALERNPGAVLIQKSRERSAEAPPDLGALRRPMEHGLGIDLVDVLPTGA